MTSSILEQPIEEQEKKKELGNKLLPYVGGVTTEVAAGLALDAKTAKLLALGPLGWLGYGVINAAGGATANIAAQKLRGEEELNWGEVISSGLLGIIPFTSFRFGKKATKLIGRPGTLQRAAIGGAGMGASDRFIQSGFNEGELPSASDVATGAITGGVFGGGLQQGGKLVVTKHLKNQIIKAQKEGDTKKLAKLVFNFRKAQNTSPELDVFGSYEDYIQKRIDLQNNLNRSIDGTPPRRYPQSGQEAAENYEEWGEILYEKTVNNPSKIQQLINQGVIKPPVGPKGSGAEMMQMNEAKALYTYMKTQPRPNIKASAYRWNQFGEPVTFDASTDKVRRRYPSRERASGHKFRDKRLGAYIERDQWIAELGDDLGEWAYEINEAVIRGMHREASQVKDFLEVDHIAPVSQLSDQLGGWRSYTNFLVLLKYLNRKKGKSRISNATMDLLGVPRTKKDAIRSTLLTDLLAPNSRIDSKDAIRLIMHDLGIVNFTDGCINIFRRPEELRLLLSDLKADELINEIEDETSRQLLRRIINSPTEMSFTQAFKEARGLLDTFSLQGFKDALAEAIRLQKYRIQQVAIRARRARGPFQVTKTEQFNPNNPDLKN